MKYNLECTLDVFQNIAITKLFLNNKITNNIIVFKMGQQCI